MAILVTGAAGFIGSATCKALHQAGVAFIGTDKTTREQIVKCDLNDAHALRSLFASHSFVSVIHLAAMLPGAASADPLQAARINVTSTVALLENAMLSGVRRFVFGSSSSVYGSAGLSAPISEDVPAAPCDVYGAGKLLVEIMGENLRQQNKIEFVSLRIATVFGAGARNTSSPWRSEIFEKLGSGTRQLIPMPYSTEDPLTIVHVDDVARMLVLLARNKSVGSPVYNTPAKLTTAGEVKRLVESVDADMEVQLSGRTRPLAPLADGSKFAEEFGFEMQSLESRLKETRNINKR